MCLSDKRGCYFCTYRKLKKCSRPNRKGQPNLANLANEKALIKPYRYNYLGKVYPDMIFGGLCPFFENGHEKVKVIYT